MKPFRRRRRTRRDMIVLGGWLFADLLLGLAMLFLVANTVGAPPPEPTPTATPDELATAEASFAAQQASNDATREALEGDIAFIEQTATAQQNLDASRSLSATETAQARATEAAMSEADLATRDAEATDEAVIAQATISAFSTEAASADADQAELSSELATISAEATQVAQEVDARATQQAEIAAISTEQAASGANTLATIEALEALNISNADALATAEAEQEALEEASASNADALATVEAERAALEAENISSADELATAQAEQALLQEQQAELQATATAFASIADSGNLNPASVEEIIQVDLNGVLSGDDDAIEEAEEEISDTFQEYVDAEGCHAGFVLLSGRAPDIAQGNQLSEAVFDLLVSTVPEVFGETDAFSQAGYETVALPNTTPTGEVVLQVFLYSGCELVGGDGE